MENQLSLNEELTTGTSSFCSFVAVTPEDRAVMYNATSNPDYKVSDYINTEIVIKDVYCEIVPIENEDGTASMLPRTVLLDMDNKSYQAVSTGIFNSVKRLITVYGMPTWKDGVRVKVKQVNTKRGSMLTLVAVI